MITTSRAAASSSANEEVTRSRPASSVGTPQQQQRDEGVVRERPASAQSMEPLSRSRQRRTPQGVDRLGVVPDVPRSRPRSRAQPGRLAVHMERAGAHGGELRYMIRAGRMLIVNVEAETGSDGGKEAFGDG